MTYSTGFLQVPCSSELLNPIPFNPNWVIFEIPTHKSPASNAFETTWKFHHFFRKKRNSSSNVFWQIWGSWSKNRRLWKMIFRVSTCLVVLLDIFITRHPFTANVITWKAWNFEILELFELLLQINYFSHKIINN